MFRVSRKAAQSSPPRGGDGVVKITVRGGGTELRQTVRREAEDGGAKNRDQRHVLAGVVDEGQEGRDRGDLHGAEKAGVLLEGAGDVPLRQGGGEGGGAAPRGAHEDDHVLGLAGAEGAVRIRDGEARVQKLPDAPGGETGLRRQLFYRVGVVRGLLLDGDQVELRLAVRPGGIVGRAEVEGGVLVVPQLPHLRGENVFKEKVGGVQNLLAGAEVLREDDLPVLAVQGLCVGLEGRVLGQEDGGVRQTEAVDALLYVPYGEEVFARLGHRLEDGVLDLVGVLVFVHQDFGVSGGDLLPQLRGAAVRGDQKGQGQVLLIGEIGGVEPELLRPEGGGKGRRQIQQGQHGRGHGPEVLQGLLPGDVQPGAEGPESILCPFPGLFQGDGEGIVLPALGSAEAGKGHGLRQLPGGGPAGGLAQLPEALGGLQEFGAVAGGQGGVSLGAGGGPAELVPPMGRPAADGR